VGLSELFVALPNFIGLRGLFCNARGLEPGSDEYPLDPRIAGGGAKVLVPVARDGLGVCVRERSVLGGVGNKPKEVCFLLRRVVTLRGVNGSVIGIIGGRLRGSGTRFLVIDFERLGRVSTKDWSGAMDVSTKGSLVSSIVKADSCFHFSPVNLVFSMSPADDNDERSDCRRRRTTHQPTTNANRITNATMIPTIAPVGKDWSRASEVCRDAGVDVNVTTEMEGALVPEAANVVVYISVVGGPRKGIELKALFVLDVSLNVVKTKALAVPVSLTESVGSAFSLPGAAFVSVGLFGKVVATACSPFPGFCPPATV
jgi:hypothetical protein